MHYLHYTLLSRHNYQHWPCQVDTDSNNHR